MKGLEEMLSREENTFFVFHGLTSKFLSGYTQLHRTFKKTIILIQISWKIFGTFPLRRRSSQGEIPKTGAAQNF